jgi:hypothetical protein
MPPPIEPQPIMAIFLTSKGRAMFCAEFEVLRVEVSPPKS